MFRGSFDIMRTITILLSVVILLVGKSIIKYNVILALHYHLYLIRFNTAWAIHKPIICTTFIIHIQYIYIRKYIKHIYRSYRNIWYTDDVLFRITCFAAFANKLYIYRQCKSIDLISSCNANMSKQLPPYTAKSRYKRNFTSFQGCPLSRSRYTVTDYYCSLYINTVLWGFYLYTRWIKQNIRIPLLYSK